LTFVLFFLLYIVITRNFQYKEYVFVLFSAALLAVFTLCILNSYGVDPLGMFEGYSAEVKRDFVSTIGNKNVMSSLCCVTAPAFLLLFIHRESSVRFLYLVTAVIGIIAMIRCDSMSGFLGFVPTFALLSLYYTRKSSKPVIKRLFWILSVVFSVVAVLFVILFIYFTFFDTKTSLDGFMKFFRFNDKWGTHRGYMWSKSWEIFKGFNIKNILFGCGTDGFYNVFEPYFAELNSRFGDTVNNAAHNVLLNYLVTTGVLGLAAYISLIVSAVVRAVKASFKNPLALAFITPVICYLLQSIVNISTIIVLPCLFIFISLSEKISRKELNAL
ncbi:MAG: O-antigen ligase family protein, partial [Ruminococcus sp.]|nr:O-antigen ligase family protein [Ruminococcus sp.]